MAEAALSVNGRLQPLEGPHLSALDRGFLLGDGLFETLRVRRGWVVRWARHLARLRAGAAVLGLPVPWADDDLAAIVERTLAAGHLSEAVVRLSVSRGVGRARGLLPDADPAPTLVVHAAPFDGYPAALYARGMQAVISRIRRNERSPLATVKSLNYLDNILARREAATRGADEALLLNTAGALAGASAANLFLVVGERLVTPALGCGALPGTVRQEVMEHLAGRVDERPVVPADLAACQEAFLTSALLEAMPLTVVEGRPIGTGQLGPTTAAVAALLVEADP